MMSPDVHAESRELCLQLIVHLLLLIHVSLKFSLTVLQSLDLLLGLVQQSLQTLETQQELKSHFYYVFMTRARVCVCVWSSPDLSDPEETDAPHPEVTSSLLSYAPVYGSAAVSHCSLWTTQHNTTHTISFLLCVFMLYFLFFWYFCSCRSFSSSWWMCSCSLESSVSCPVRWHTSSCDTRHRRSLFCRKTQHWCWSEISVTVCVCVRAPVDLDWSYHTPDPVERLAPEEDLISPAPSDTQTHTTDSLHHDTRAHTD